MRLRMVLDKVKVSAELAIQLRAAEVEAVAAEGEAVPIRQRKKPNAWPRK